MVITEEVIKLLFDTGGTIEDTGGGALEEFSESCIFSIEEGISWILYISTHLTNIKHTTNQ